MRLLSLLFALAIGSPLLWAQSVCIPQPRLLNLSPMGGQLGSQVELTITGDHLDEAGELLFNHPGIQAVALRDAQGNPQPNKYTLAIAADCPTGIYEARVMSRLGISSARVFSVDNLPEVSRATANTTLATAMELSVDSICNASATSKAIDYYRFSAKQGERILVHCASKSIDSKLEAVLIVADANARDLLVQRRGGLIDFHVPADGTYVIKVHDLTFNGGPAWFYRLSLRRLAESAPVPELPSTQAVSAFSWPPTELPTQAGSMESEPNNSHTLAQKIELPCDIAGSFHPAADVDMYEFTGKKGDVWWIEVASERLGLPTDPTLVVQLASSTDSNSATYRDILELSDIASPIKTSSNGYAYDGPPYQPGSTDILGKLEIPEDGTYHLQLSDLFGGTRCDPRNIYRLVIRRAQPDFALVAWGLHMELRNGDRAALSKPISLRAGQTIALEVVALRRDGFNGPIELSMENLPAGVTARGITIPADKSRGIMLVTAHESATTSFANVEFVGRAELDGAIASRPCRWAEMTWPVPDSWGEIPVPRLLQTVPVSVSAADPAPISIRPRDAAPIEVAAGQKVTVPLVLQRRTDFSGTQIQFRTFGDSFERAPQWSVPITADTAEATFDTAALKTAPGQYTIAFYGGAVAKYQDNPAAVTIAETLQRQADQAVKELDAKIQSLTEQLANPPAEAKASLEQQLAEAKAQKETAAAHAKQAADRLTAAKNRATPKDTVDIVVSEPITIHVKP